MAHELTLRADGRAEMAFVGETPWHGLGQNVTEGASIDVWRKEAGLEWSALEATPHIRAGVLGVRDQYKDIEFPDYKALIRSDTHDPLAIVGKDYQLVQPARVLEFFRDVTETGGWHIHTAGSLRGGRKVWAMATTKDARQFVKGTRITKAASKDDVRLNLVLATSLDGSMKTTALLTTVSVVCANTLRAALGSAQSMVRVSHRSVFDERLVKELLGVAPDTFRTFMQKANELAETPVDLTQARDLLNKVFRDPNAKAKPNLSWLGNIADIDAQPEPEDARATLRVLELFDGAGMGADLPTRHGTAWGLLNGVTQYVDHEMGRSRDTGLDSAWFGRGDQFKQQMVELLTEEEEA